MEIKLGYFVHQYQRSKLTFIPEDRKWVKLKPDHSHLDNVSSFATFAIVDDLKEVDRWAAEHPKVKFEARRYIAIKFKNWKYWKRFRSPCVTIISYE